ncbi:MAG TPA: chorismate synthase [Armatimonadota bacterium]|nr:chorismate synthase [Armatimonadota bacterium]
MRLLSAGESHGPGLVVILDGVPAGLALEAADINLQLRRRQGGYGRGGRMRIEQDAVEIRSGVRFGETIGSPLALLIANRDWENWRAVMAVSGEPVGDPVTVPRPGHADLAGALKYGRRDLRDVLERASARETAARVAAGAVARKLLARLGVEIGSRVLAIGAAEARIADQRPWRELQQAAEASDVGCADDDAAQRMRAEIDAAREAGDTVGGVFEVTAQGVPPGLGAFAQWDLRLDGRLAQAFMSIPAIKGVEIGIGFAAARVRGSAAHDALVPGEGARGVSRPTNRAGGIEGGVTNGQPVVVRAAMKPIPTLTAPLDSVDLATGEPAPAHAERSDVCAVPAARVVGEAMMALALADAVTDKFGGDTMAEIERNLRAYLDSLAAGMGP